MLSNKEIRSIPKPKITAEIKILASQSRHTAVLTAQKYKKYICLNFFTKKEEEVILYMRYIYPQKITAEGYLCKLQENIITKGYLNRIYDYYSTTYTSSEKTFEKLKKWHQEKNHVYEGFDAISLSSLLSHICTARENEKKKLNRENHKNDINAIMAKIRPVPKKFQKTIDRSMKFSRYIFFNRKSKECFCTNCQNEFHMNDIPVHMTKGKCPLCNTPVVFFSEGRRYNMRPDMGSSVLIQAYGYHKLAVRYFNISYDYRCNRLPEESVFETYRTIIDYDKKNTTDYTYWYFDGSEMSWDKVKAFMSFSGYHYDFFNGYLHKNGLSNELKKAGVYGWFDGGEKFIRSNYRIKSVVDHTRYYELLALHPEIEKLVKCGLFRLAKDTCYSYSTLKVIDLKAASLKDMVKAKDRLQLKEMIKNNVSRDQLESIQLHNQLSPVKNRSVKDIIYLAEISGYKKSFLFSLTRGKCNKVLDYLQMQETNATSMKDKLSFYTDYIDFCKKLGYDLSMEMVLYPKDLQTAHDQASIAVQTEKNKRLHEMIAPLLRKMHEMYDFYDEENGILIKAPDSEEEIRQEGLTLHHCVGTYIDRVAEGKTVILFVRKISEPDTPFVTMEVNNGKVVQVRAFANKDPNEAVKLCVNKFKREKLLAA